MEDLHGIWLRQAASICNGFFSGGGGWGKHTLRGFGGHGPVAPWIRHYIYWMDIVILCLYTGLSRSSCFMSSSLLRCVLPSITICSDCLVDDYLFIHNLALDTLSKAPMVDHVLLIIFLGRNMAMLRQNNLFIVVFICTYFWLFYLRWYLFPL